MTTLLTQPTVTPATQLSAAARATFEANERSPFMFNDWMSALFVHYEVSPEALQPFVPYELDLHNGKAYVSLVAFHMRNLRFGKGGSVAACLMRPIASHGFLNVRTYVKHEGETGIFFLAEWLPNALSVFLGPRTFGLPYRYGKLDYRHDHERGDVSGVVSAADGRLAYRAEVENGAEFGPCAAGTLTEFLVERYNAFTERRGVRRRFRVWHEPWAQAAVDVAVEDASLVRSTGSWFEEAKLVGANYSVGVEGVWIGWPACVNGKYCGIGWKGEAR